MTDHDHRDPPDHLSDESAAWWRALVQAFHFEAHHLRLLEAACTAWDRAQEAAFGGPEEGRRAWARLASTYRSNPGTRCAPFWHYTEGVPFELRGAGEPGAPDLRERRLRWLLGAGQDHLRPGETEWIRRELDPDAGDPG